MTVDIFFRKEKSGKKSHTPQWTKTPKIFISGYNKQLALNEYFRQHKHHIIGNLTVADIYDKIWITCRKNGYDTFKVLQGLIQQTVENKKAA